MYSLICEDVRVIEDKINCEGLFNCNRNLMAKPILDLWVSHFEWEIRSCTFGTFLTCWTCKRGIHQYRGRKRKTRARANPYLFRATPRQNNREIVTKAIKKVKVHPLFVVDTVKMMGIVPRQIHFLVTSPPLQRQAARSEYPNC